MKFITSLSTVFPSAIVATTLASVATSTNAMPILEERQSQCSEAARFGIMQISPTSNLKIGDEIKVSYIQNCPQLQNVYPSSFALGIGQSGSQSPFVQVTAPQAYPGVGKTLEFTAKIPDFYTSGFYKSDEYDFLGTIEYSNQGPEGTNATLFYTSSIGFTYDAPSSS